METALISGITGQDGSYLSELLLSKNYDVHGIVRRGSTINTKRVNHLIDKDNFELHYGDLGDANSLIRIIQQIKPDEIYNIGSMSHVRVSFDIPEYTGRITGLGVTRMLEAIRSTNPKIKFYQASSSEMYGDTPAPQNENTPFHPQSPYGCAKLYGYWMTRAYRKGYNMFASNGILFNHECVSPKNVITIRKNNRIKICYIEDLKKQHGDYATQITDFNDKNIEIMTSEGFKKIKTLTIRSAPSISDSSMRCIETRNGLFYSTNDHNCLTKSNTKISTKNVIPGIKLKTCNFEISRSKMFVEPNLASFLGYMVADGCISSGKMFFVKNNSKIRQKVGNLFKQLFIGGYTESFCSSGFSNKKVKRLNFNGISKEILNYIHSLIYNKDKTKKVPEVILNSSKEIMLSFFDAYYECDGLKVDKCVYKYKAIKSNSPILLQGLYYINQVVIKQSCTFYSIFEPETNKRYYCLNFNTPIKTQKGKHLQKNKFEVTKTNIIKKERWVYDLETENGEFQVGVGNIVVANSPRRGETFVTKKIIRAACRIKLGLQDKVSLGNLEAKRDWGHSKDFCNAIYMIMQYNIPDDFVVATEEYHTIHSFLEEVFKRLNLPLDEHVEFDKRFLRPNEVPELRGDATKIRDVLGWKPKISYSELIDDMIKNAMLEEKTGINQWG